MNTIHSPSAGPTLPAETLRAALASLKVHKLGAYLDDLSEDATEDLEDVLANALRDSGWPADVQEAVVDRIVELALSHRLEGGLDSPIMHAIRVARVHALEGSERLGTPQQEDFAGAVMALCRVIIADARIGEILEQVAPAGVRNRQQFLRALSDVRESWLAAWMREADAVKSSSSLQRCLESSGVEAEVAARLAGEMAQNAISACQIVSAGKAPSDRSLNIQALDVILTHPELSAVLEHAGDIRPVRRGRRKKPSDAETVPEVEADGMPEKVPLPNEIEVQQKPAVATGGAQGVPSVYKQEPHGASQAMQDSSESVSGGAMTQKPVAAQEPIAVSTVTQHHAKIEKPQTTLEFLEAKKVILDKLFRTQKNQLESVRRKLEGAIREQGALRNRVNRNANFSVYFPHPAQHGLACLQDSTWQFFENGKGSAVKIVDVIHGQSEQPAKEKFLPPEMFEQCMQFVREMQEVAHSVRERLGSELTAIMERHFEGCGRVDCENDYSLLKRETWHLLDGDARVSLQDALDMLPEHDRAEAGKMLAVLFREPQALQHRQNGDQNAPAREESENRKNGQFGRTERIAKGQYWEEGDRMSNNGIEIEISQIATLTMEAKVLSSKNPNVHVGNELTFVPHPTSTDIWRLSPTDYKAYQVGMTLRLQNGMKTIRVF